MKEWLMNRACSVITGGLITIVLIAAVLLAWRDEVSREFFMRAAILWGVITEEVCYRILKEESEEEK